jgi:hypothetical protein
MTRDFAVMRIVWSNNPSITNGLAPALGTPWPAQAQSRACPIWRPRAHVAGRGESPRRTRLSHSSRLRIAQAT